MNLDTNNHSVFKLSYHLVLVIKYRRKVIDDDKVYKPPKGMNPKVAKIY